MKPRPLIYYINYVYRADCSVWVCVTVLLCPLTATEQVAMTTARLHGLPVSSPAHLVRILVESVLVINYQLN